MNNGARFFIPTPALPKGKPTPALPKGGRKEVGTLFYKPPLPLLLKRRGKNSPLFKNSWNS